ncbi:AraC family ligand binding domain-containing protein [Chryseolinea sp. T2]|uniref:AraC family ligand binding domain-containing protein n=1 Tax=Chryseolinea sp. T2 TaxID=3129255 RepID=UPI003077B30C
MAVYFTSSLRLVFGALLVAVPIMLQAQVTSSRAVIKLNSAQIDSASSSKLTPDKPGRLLATGPSGERYLVVVRTGEGAVEIHEQYDDVAVIRAGHGVLRTGPSATGAKLSGTAPNREWLGGEIRGAKEYKVAQGDFLVIPAGLAHQYVPDSGDSLVYFTVKVRQADLKGSKK